MNLLLILQCLTPAPEKSSYNHSGAFPPPGIAIEPWDEAPNDPSSATAATRRADCNRDDPPPFAAAHGYASFIFLWEPLFSRQPQKDVDFSQRKLFKLVKALEALDDLNKAFIVFKIDFVEAIETVYCFIVQHHLFNK
jgi:hypothetical protein